MTIHKKREMLLQLDAKAKEPLYRQIYAQMRDAIAAGTLTQGDRLPSIRRVCTNMGVAHTTVEQAYSQLAVEGYVQSIPRSGYRVEHFDAQFLRQLHEDNAGPVPMSYSSHDAFNCENARARAARYDFSYANLQPDSFPVKTWLRLTSDVLYAYTAPQLSHYAFTDENSALSVELTRYLTQARGLRCVPEQVLPQAGTDGAVATILQLFDRNTHILAMEEPGFPTVREVAQRMGFTLVGLPVEEGPDAYFEALEKHCPKIIFATPSHQFPTGHLMSLSMRVRLLRWAEEHHAFIIEDDSCDQYRYKTAPIPSLQSLDAHHRVIYLNSVSKVLSPALRIAYMVLSVRLMKRYFQQFAHTHPPVSQLEQDVLARFIEQGYWEQHIRRMATGNRKRHDELIAAIDAEFGDRVSVEGANSGMHLFCTIHNKMTQEELIHRAAAQGVAVYSTKRMWFSKPAPENKLLIGFSSIAQEDIAPGIAALRRAWF